MQNNLDAVLDRLGSKEDQAKLIQKELTETKDMHTAAINLWQVYKRGLWQTTTMGNFLSFRAWADQVSQSFKEKPHPRDEPSRAITRASFMDVVRAVERVLSYADRFQTSHGISPDFILAAKYRVKKLTKAGSNKFHQQGNLKPESPYLNAVIRDIADDNVTFEEFKERIRN